MKKLLVLSLVFSFFAIGFTFTSCKYDEGPAISLRSKAARLEGTWVLEEVTESGVSVMSNYSDDFELLIKDDNTFELTENNVTLPGEWNFNDDKTELHLLLDGDSEAEEFVIIQLKNKEMIIEQKESSTVPMPHRFFFVQLK